MSSCVVKYGSEEWGKKLLAYAKKRANVTGRAYLVSWHEETPMRSLMNCSFNRKLLKQLGERFEVIRRDRKKLPTNKN